MITLRNICFVCSLLTLSACVGSPEELDSAGSQAVLGEELGTDPVPPAQWESAPASCEGRLSTGVSFRSAGGAIGLLAAIAPDGQVVCVDSVASVRVELEQEGNAPAPNVGASTTSLSSNGANFEPTPQPNVQPASPHDNTGTNQEPTPQPNMQPRHNT